MQNESSYQTISPTVERHWESDKQALYSSNSLEGFALLNFQAILDSPNQLPQHILVHPSFKAAIDCKHQMMT